jgi:hypothetical protein
MQDKSNFVLFFLCAAQIAVIAGAIFWSAAFRSDTDAAGGDPEPTPANYQKPEIDLY